MSGPEKPFQRGDLVCRADIADEMVGDNTVGHVVGFCPSPRWIRVRTTDGRYRIWLKENVHNVDYDMEEGSYRNDR